MTVKLAECRCAEHSIFFITLIFKMCFYPVTDKSSGNGIKVNRRRLVKDVPKLLNFQVTCGSSLWNKRRK